jgi:glycerophosphoryl diester phosphodiesterase
MRLVSILLLTATLMSIPPPSHYIRKTNVAHRGASAYAPEHTLAAYRLAIEQGADFVEQDLAVTRDGVLICLHDPTLERTTNVEEVFPARSTEVEDEGRKRRAWLANDFTLAEIKQLDAGSWFAPTFAGERVPTFDEAVALVKGKAGMFPELKTPEVYEGRDVHFEELVAAALDRHGLRGGRADPRTPVILQTFGESSARRLARDEDRRAGGPAHRARRWVGPVPRAVVEGRRAGSGAGQGDPVLKNPAFVQWAHAEGLTVTPYTFRIANPGGFPSVKAEMEHYLYTLGVDALFTDNPDQFPRR